MLANHPLKFNNAINTCLINLNIISYHAFLLNIYEYPRNHQYQYYQLKNHTYICVVRFFSCYQLQNLLKYYPNLMEMHLFQNLLL